MNKGAHGYRKRRAGIDFYDSPGSTMAVGEYIMVLGSISNDQ